MDYARQHHQSLIGCSVDALPTPALLLRRSVVEQNVAQLLRDVDATGLDFRLHVKTLKTLEITRMVLAGGKHRKIVVSTLAELRGVLPLVAEGLLEEVLYGLPVPPGQLPELARLQKLVRIALMVDSPEHLDALERFAAQTEAPRWPLFVKLDVGTARAGLPIDSPELKALVERVLASASSSATPAYELGGFYCHAGHSYSGRSVAEAEAALAEELSAVTGAAARWAASATREKPLVLSIGATPTAHVVRSLQASLLPQQQQPDLRLELHAGNALANDLQQLATGLVSRDQLAVRVVAEVCGVYPDRNEALINAGTIALSKETAAGVPGFGVVAGKPGWVVQRMSQEHGILAFDRAAATNSALVGGDAALVGGDAPAVGKTFRIGDKVMLYCVHTCITSSAFQVYFVLDDKDCVQETWVPWRGW